MNLMKSTDLSLEKNAYVQSVLHIVLGVEQASNET